MGLVVVRNNKKNERIKKKRRREEENEKEFKRIGSQKVGQKKGLKMGSWL